MFPEISITNVVLAAGNKASEDAMTVAEVLNIISIVAFSLSLICLIVAVFFWFKYNIYKVIGDLSGRNAKKAVMKMREANEKSGKKIHRPTSAAKSRGTVTEKMKEVPSVKPQNEPEKDNNATEILSYSSGGDTMLLDEEETAANAKKQQALKENDAFEMITNIVMIHTKEVIQ